MSITTEIIELLNIPRELALEFIAVFARFEYALKRAGYVVGDEKSASADWDRFARDLRDLGLATKQILECCMYLREHPPRKQVIREKRLVWAIRPPAGSVIEDVLLNVRTVRNNMFHGGKFPSALVSEPLRDRQLIQDCLAVLKSLLTLDLPNDVVRYFHPG